MANEATITSRLTIRKGNLQYDSSPSQFRADVTAAKGPSPGAITVTTAGVDVDLSVLENPSLCRMMNLDETNYVEYGVTDPENNLFIPLGEIRPGESYILRLSRNLQTEYVGTGTGTGDSTNRLHLKANTASCVVLVEAFEE